MPAYLEKPPSEKLRGIVTSFWSLEDDGQNGRVENIFPDGHVEWTFNLGDPIVRLHENGERERQPYSLIVGQMRGPVRLRPTGKVKLFGVRFHPGGARMLLSMPVAELTEHIQDLTRTVEDASGLTERLADARSLEDRAAIMESFLMAKLHYAVKLTDPLVYEMIKRLSIDFRPTEIVAGGLGFSYRQIQRRFIESVGLGPKEFSRIVRFQHVFQSMQGRSEWSWQEALRNCHYYDQAHFIREFRRLSGQTPSDYAVTPSRLSAYFTQQYRMSEIYNTKRTSYPILHAQD
jgi:AraC-like DNA-binding protein